MFSSRVSKKSSKTAFIENRVFKTRVWNSCEVIIYNLSEPAGGGACRSPIVMAMVESRRRGGASVPADRAQSQSGGCALSLFKYHWNIEGHLSLLHFLMKVGFYGDHLGNVERAAARGGGSSSAASHHSNKTAVMYSVTHYLALTVWSISSKQVFIFTSLN